MFDIAQIRKQFPILNSNQTDKPLVYLDNAATTHKPKVVIDRLTQFYSKENSNIHRGIYELAFNATRHYELARQTVSNFINARSPDEIVFCRGTTEALNMITQGLRSQLRPEDEILVTAMEHHANYVPWQTVCKQSGARFRVAPVKPDGSLDLDQLQNMISSKTKVFAVTHISNTLGTINPLSKIVEIARKKGALVVVDGAQSIAFDSIDIQEIGCDFFAFSGHKAFGPMGVGVLYGKMEQLSTLEPYQQGGAMIVSVTEDQTTFKPPPQGLEAGTPPVAGAIALATALDFISGLGLKQIKEHSQSTLQYAKHRLSSIQGLKQIGPASGTSNILSFLLDNVHPHDIATIMSEAGVAVRAGHHCTQPLMQALGINSTVRVSFSIYNDKDEVDQLVDALRTVKKIMS